MSVSVGNRRIISKCYGNDSLGTVEKKKEGSELWGHCMRLLGGVEESFGLSSILHGRLHGLMNHRVGVRVGRGFKHLAK